MFQSANLGDSSLATLDAYEGYGCRELAFLLQPRPEREPAEYGTRYIIGMLVGIAKEDVQNSEIYCRRMLGCMLIEYSKATDQERMGEWDRAVTSYVEHGEFFALDKRDGR